jgi:hypothetical protein
MRKSLVAFFAAATLLAACTPAADKPVDADTATGEAMENDGAAMEAQVEADARVMQEEAAL